MADELLDVGACGLEILARVELVGMLVEELTDGAGHGQTQVGVDVDLADGELGSLTQLILGHADGVGHLAAVLVDHLDVLLRDGGGAVQHDREAGQTLGDFLQHVEAEGRRDQDALLIAGALLGLELVCAVAGADGDGQRVAAGLGDELLDFFGMGVGSLVCGDLHFVLDAGQRAELSFDDDAVVVRVLDDLLGDLDVLGKGLGGGVDHNGGEAAVDAALAGLKVGAVVQMQNDGDIGAANYGSLDQFDQIVVVRVGASTLGDLQDNGSVLFLAGFGDALNDFHVVDVESADGVAAVVSLLEHFGCSYQRHNDISLFYSNSIKDSSKFQ